MRGLVLDLRNNPGGLLDQAVRVSDVFLSSGVIVTTAGRGRRNVEVERAHEKDTEPAYPMIVLVNKGTASASEIVAGALQDHGRAVIMGTADLREGLGPDHHRARGRLGAEAHGGALLHARRTARSRSAASRRTSWSPTSRRRGPRTSQPGERDLEAPPAERRPAPARRARRTAPPSRPSGRRRRGLPAPDRPRLPEGGGHPEGLRRAAARRPDEEGVRPAGAEAPRMAQRGAKR